MMKRKLTSLFLATAMVMTTLAGCGNSGGKPAAKVDTSEAAQGKVLNIYCWNQEFQERFEYFKKSGKLPSDVKVNFVVTPNENNAYQNALDAALLKQKDARPLAGNTARSAPILAPSTVQAAISCPRAAGGSTGIIAAGGAGNRPPVRWPYIPACRCGR